MKLTDLFEKKLNDVKINDSNGNYRFYKSHIHHFIKWADNNVIYDTKDVTASILSDYITDMKKTCTNATINKRIGIIKRAYKHNNIDFEYLQSIKKLKEQKKTFNMIDNDQLKQIINYAKSLPNNNNSIMYKLLTLLLIDTGARINEILSIEKKNINLSANEILLTTTKTKEDRIVYFLDDTRKVLSDVLKLNLDTKNVLYNEMKKRPMHYEDVRFFLRKIKSELNIKTLHAHMFRHTFATRWLENDADLLSVMQVLGHKNIETTERYLHASNKHIKKTYLEKFKRG